MKIIFVLITMTISSIALATIKGPSCEELNSSQKRLLKSAAQNYVYKKFARGEVVIGRGSIVAEEADCHDYDGVHSNTEFEVTWDQTDVDQEMECKISLAVAAGYDLKKKEKIIDKKTKFEIEETDDVSCNN